MRRTLLAVLCVLSASACEPAGTAEALRAEADSLRGELARLSAELEEIKFGPERLLAAAEAALESEAFDDAASQAGELIERHPAAAEVERAGKIVSLAAAGKEAARRTAEAEQRAEEAARKERIRSAVARMSSKHDDVRGVTSYFDRSISRFVNDGGSKMLLYIMDPDDGTPYLRFSIRYLADEWLFVESYTIKADDRTFTIDASGYAAVERDNGYGGIWEWYDVSAETRELEIVRAVINAERTVLRYNGGQYYKDRTITASEKASLRNVLVAFDALRNAELETPVLPGGS